LNALIPREVKVPEGSGDRRRSRPNRVVEVQRATGKETAATGAIRVAVVEPNGRTGTKTNSEGCAATRRISHAIAYVEYFKSHYSCLACSLCLHGECCTSVGSVPAAVDGCSAVRSVPTTIAGCSAVRSVPTAIVGCSPVRSVPTAIVGCSPVRSIPASIVGCSSVRSVPPTVDGCSSVGSVPATVGCLVPGCLCPCIATSIFRLTLKSEACCLSAIQF
jgi:hypothetical protein